MFCIKCGNKLVDGANFCFNCGAKVCEMKDEQVPVEEIEYPKHVGVNIPDNKNPVETPDFSVMQNAIGAFFDFLKALMLQHNQYACHPTEPDAILAAVLTDVATPGSFEVLEGGCVADMLLASYDKKTWFRCMVSEIEDIVCSGGTYYISDYMLKGCYKVTKENLAEVLEELDSDSIFALYKSPCWKDGQLSEITTVTVQEFLASFGAEDAETVSSSEVDTIYEKILVRIQELQKEKNKDISELKTDITDKKDTGFELWSEEYTRSEYENLLSKLLELKKEVSSKSITNKQFSDAKTSLLTRFSNNTKMDERKMYLDELAKKGCITTLDVKKYTTHYTAFSAYKSQKKYIASLKTATINTLAECSSDKILTEVFKKLIDNKLIDATEESTYRKAVVEYSCETKQYKFEKIFPISHHNITVSTRLQKFNSIYVPYMSFTNDTIKAFIEEYKSSMRETGKQTEKYFEDFGVIISETFLSLIKKALELLRTFNIELSMDDFSEEYMDSYFDFSRYSSPIVERYIQILQESENLELQRQIKAMGRGVWQGGGSTIPRAITGAVIGAGLNFGTNAILNTFGRIKNDLKINRELRKLFVNDDVLQSLAGGFSACAIGMFEACMRELELNDIDIYVDLDNEQKEANTMFEKIKLQTNPEAIEGTIACIQSFPYCKEFYIKLYDLYDGDSDTQKQIESLAAFFGCIKKVYEYKLNQTFALYDKNILELTEGSLSELTNKQEYITKTLSEIIKYGGGNASISKIKSDLMLVQEKIDAIIAEQKKQDKKIKNADDSTLPCSSEKEDKKEGSEKAAKQSPKGFRTKKTNTKAKKDEFPAKKLFDLSNITGYWNNHCQKSWTEMCGWINSGETVESCLDGLTKQAAAYKKEWAIKNHNVQLFSKIKPKVQGQMSSDERMLFYKDNGVFFYGKSGTLITDKNIFCINKNGVEKLALNEIRSIHALPVLSSCLWFFNSNVNLEVNHMYCSDLEQGVIMAMICLLVQRHNGKKCRITVYNARS